MGKLRADGQEPHRRPTWRDEVAQHTEIAWYARGGKCGGSAAEQRALTWGDLHRETGAEVSRGHSSRGNEPECAEAQQSSRRSHLDEGPNR